MKNTGYKQIFFSECQYDADDILTVEDDEITGDVWVNVGTPYQYDREAICLSRKKAVTMAHKILDYYGESVSE